MTDFHNSFTGVLSCKFAIKLLIKIPPHLRRVAALRYCEMFQQDSAPAHRARETIKLLQRETPAFISPDLWPPNSRDLNPVNYKIWKWCKVVSTRKKVKDVNELRERLVEVWAGLQQNVIDDAIDQWRSRRLRACLRARGGHCEYLLWLTALAT